MSVELVLYHIMVLLVGAILGTFIVAVVPLKSDAQAWARNVYLQGIALLFAICLALYYTLGYIENEQQVSGLEAQSEVVAASFIDTFVDRLSVPLAQIEGIIHTYRKDEVI